jgi:hypothetical protein
MDLLDLSKVREVEPRKMAEMWVATTDARNYIIVGDPAVRLRVGGNHPFQHPTIQAGLQLDGSEAAQDEEIRSASTDWVEGGRGSQGLVHLGERLEQIRVYGSLFTRSEAQHT